MIHPRNQEKSWFEWRPARFAVRTFIWWTESYPIRNFRSSQATRSSAESSLWDRTRIASMLEIGLEFHGSDGPAGIATTADLVRRIYATNRFSPDTPGTEDMQS